MSLIVPSIYKRSQRFYSSLRVPLSSIELHVPKQFDIRPPTARVTKLSNGISVATIENHELISNVGVFVNVGNRVETTETFGITQLLRRLTFKGIENKPAVVAIRELENITPNFSVSCDRERFLFSGVIPNDSNNLDYFLSLLSKLIFKRKSAEWEVKQTYHELTGESQTVHNNITDLLHSTAYRYTALGRPLFPNPFTIPEYSPSTFTEFVNQHFVPPKVAIIADGNITHKTLVNIAKETFSFLEPKVTKEIPSVYEGGQTLVYTPSDTTHFLLAYKGAGFVDEKKVLIFSLIKHLLGVAENQRPGSGLTARLNLNVVQPNQQWIKSASSFSFSYSDSGLFGIYAVVQSGSAHKVYDVLTKELSKLANRPVDQAELARAKKALAFSWLNFADQRKSRLEMLGWEALFNKEITMGSDFIYMIDSITAEDVKSAIAAALSSRPTVVAHGDVSGIASV